MAHNHAQVVKFDTVWAADGNTDKVTVAVVGKDRHQDDGEFVAMIEVADGRDHRAVKDAVNLMTEIASSDSKF